MGQIQFAPQAAVVKATNYAVHSQTYGTNFPFGVLLFDPSNTWDAYFVFRMPPDYSSSPSLDIDWEAAATTSAVKWECAIGSSASNAAASWETKSLATAQSTTTTVSSTANGPNRTTISITNTDSTAAGHWVVLRVSRVGGDAADTMSGNAIGVLFTLNYS